MGVICWNTDETRGSVAASALRLKAPWPQTLTINSVVYEASSWGPNGKRYVAKNGNTISVVDDTPTREDKTDNR